MTNENAVKTALAAAMALPGCDQATKQAICKEIIRQYRAEQEHHAAKKARLERAMQWPKTQDFNEFAVKPTGGHAGNQSIGENDA